ncbi:MAG: nicotinate (nicotinamide) nucleotide adenylyltransferase [Planctomycetota bacterium]
MEPHSRVALFGGSFDPVHRGHLEVARRAGQAFDLDRILFTPAATPPHKLGQTLAPGAARVAMLEAATADRPDWEVSDVELRREGTSFTVDTLRELASEAGGAPSEGGAALHMILGSDNLPGLPGWKDVEEVLTLARPIVAWREGTPEEHLAALDGRLPAALVERLAEGFLRLPPIPVSATEIRALVAEGRLAEADLPEGVAELIVREGLYGAAAREASA